MTLKEKYYNKYTLCKEFLDITTEEIEYTISKYTELSYSNLSYHCRKAVELMEDEEEKITLLLLNERRKNLLKQLSTLAEIRMDLEEL